MDSPHWAGRPTCDFSDSGRVCQDSSDTTCVALWSTKLMSVNCSTDEWGRGAAGLEGGYHLKPGPLVHSAEQQQTSLP